MLIPRKAALVVALRPALAALVLLLSAEVVGAQLPAPGSTYHLLFATAGLYRTTTTPSLPPPTLRFNRISGADWQVMSAAIDAELPGTLGWDEVSTVYRAILTVSGDNARDRLSVSGPVYNLHGTVLATSHADLFDGNLATPVAYDEYGWLITSNVDVWTGSTPVGTAGGQECGSWDNVSNSVTGRIGDATDSGTSWLGAGVTKACNQGARLYGLSPELTAPLWGDYDDDGDVDAADYVLWRKAEGSSNSLLGKNRSFLDGNTSQPVGPADYAVWRTYFGQTLPVMPAAAVPEPPGAVFLFLALAAVSLVRGRKS